MCSDVNRSIPESNNNVPPINLSGMLPTAGGDVPAGSRLYGGLGRSLFANTSLKVSITETTPLGFGPLGFAPNRPPAKPISTPRPRPAGYIDPMMLPEAALSGPSIMGHKMVVDYNSEFCDIHVEVHREINAHHTTPVDMHLQSPVVVAPIPTPLSQQNACSEATQTTVVAPAAFAPGFNSAKIYVMEGHDLFGDREESHSPQQVVETARYRNECSV